MIEVTDDGPTELAQTIGDKDVCLMRGHGITSCGPSIEAAGLAAIQVNELAVMNYRANLLGTPRPISDEDIASLPVGPGSGRIVGTAAWETYRRMVDG